MTDPRGYATLTGDDFRILADVVDVIEDYGTEVTAADVSIDSPGVIRATVDITFSRYHVDKIDRIEADILNELEGRDDVQQGFVDRDLYLDDDDPAAAMVEVTFQRGDGDG